MTIKELKKQMELNLQKREENLDKLIEVSKRLTKLYEDVVDTQMMLIKILKVEGKN